MILPESNATKLAPGGKLAPLRSKKSGSCGPSPSLQQVSPLSDPGNVFGSPSPLPPQYIRKNRPSKPVTYAFRPMPWSSMLLAPPENIGDAHEPYSVSVTPNCFTPSSFITTVRRNSLDGEFVGSFEVGPSVPNTVCLRGNEYPLNDALSVHPFRRNVWTWTTFDHDKPVTLHWEGKDVLLCFRSKDKTVSNLVAKFVQKTAPPREGRAVVHAKLELTPEGHDFFDDVIMSVLIVERLRTLPSSHIYF